MRRSWRLLVALAALGTDACGGPPAVVRPTGTPPLAPVVIRGDLDASVLLGDLPQASERCRGGGRERRRLGSPR